MLYFPPAKKRVDYTLSQSDDKDGRQYKSLQI
jgi:predicted small lipoprotein YifL